MNTHIAQSAPSLKSAEQPQPIVINMTSPIPRKNGIANVRDALAHAGVTSRTTLIDWERKGLFPKRVSLGRGRVGWRWSDLYAWSDSLQAVEGE